MTYKWGTYLVERQWGTVREDYSAEGDAWNYFPHDHARSRVYRWGEDGLAGWSDDQQRLCFALALWNGKDPILKERLFGLTNGEGNHGEDVKELYYYEDNTPAHDYARMRYLYPQAEFPYRELVEVNAQRGRLEPEYELADTGVFKENRYFDIAVEYAKAADHDMCIQITIRNCGPEPVPLWVLPTLWFRNRWSFGVEAKPGIAAVENHAVLAKHVDLGEYLFCFEKTPTHLLFTDNETNTERLFNSQNVTPFVKDAFHKPQYGVYVRQFFERFEQISAALHALQDAVGDDFQGFYFDLLTLPDGERIPLRVHSFVGLIPLFAGLSLGAEDLANVPDFADFFKGFLQKNNVSDGCIFADNNENPTRYLLSFIPPERLEKLLSAVFDSVEMLADYGIRSVSKRHEAGIGIEVNGTFFEMHYVPGESDSGMFGGNSNWRGPVWIPVNFLLVDTLRRYHVFFGDTVTIEVPAGSGRRITLGAAADELCHRLLSLFLPDENGYRILHGEPDTATHPPDFHDNILFYEYFHADSGRGLGASHQTGWTALVGML